MKLTDEDVDCQVERVESNPVPVQYNSSNPKWDIVTPL